MMADDVNGTEGGSSPLRAMASSGDMLKAARESAGLSRAEVSAKTRIPERHLLALEAGDFAALPGRTYAIGFAKTFARAVGLDQAEVAAAITRDYAGSAPAAESAATPAFAPGDPARVPSSRFAWAAAAAVLVVGIGGFVWWQHTLSPAADLPSLLPEDKPAAVAPSVAPSAAPVAAPSAQPTGPVVFTAEVDGLWVKFYDGAGKQLLQKQLAKGESYTVPADAAAPKLWTGRPEALAITVGGQAVPKLSDTQKTMKDVPVTAEALLARGKPASTPAPAATPAAAPTASPIPGAAATTAAPRPKPTHKPVRHTAPAGDSAPPPAAPETPSTAAQ